MLNAECRINSHKFKSSAKQIHSFCIMHFAFCIPEKTNFCKGAT